jgi:hypothetical protein
LISADVDHCEHPLFEHLAGFLPAMRLIGSFAVHLMFCLRHIGHVGHFSEHFEQQSALQQLLSTASSNISIHITHVNSSLNKRAIRSDSVVKLVLLFLLL